MLTNLQIKLGHVGLESVRFIPCNIQGKKILYNRKRVLNLVLTWRGQVMMLMSLGLPLLFVCPDLMKSLNQTRPSI